MGYFLKKNCSQHISKRWPNYLFNIGPFAIMKICQMWLVQNFTQYKQAKIPSNVLSTTHVTDNFSCDHLKCKITKMGNLRPLFIYFSLFYKQSIVNNCSIKVAVTGFEPGSSGSGRERTVTVPQPLPLQCKFITRRNRCCTVQKRSLFHYTG